MGMYDHPDASKAAEFRRSAIEAGVKAAKAKDEFTRDSWLTIASSYQDLAVRLERNFKP
jgi:hypothetical protein